MPNAAGMTYQPHIRAQWGGFLGNTRQEIWSNSVAFHSGGTPFSPGYLPDRDQLVEASAGVLAALGEWMGRPGSFISAQARLEFLKLNVILENGKQRDLDTVSRTLATPRAGNQTSSEHPWQVSWALTLRSDTFTRGRGHSGRIYPPAVSAPLENYGPYCTFPAALLMAESFRTCLNDMAQSISDAVDVPAGDVYHPVIASPGNFARGQQGMNSNIDRVVCDRVADTQRRRVQNIPRSEGAPALIVQP